MKIEAGMPTLVEQPELEACCRLCRELGLCFVELNMNMPEYQLDRLDRDKLRAMAKKYGVYFTLHLDENLNVCDFNPWVAEAYQRTALEALKLAEQCAMPIVNMHLNPGVYFTLPDRRVYLFEQYRERYLTELEKFRDRVGLRRDVLLAVENNDGFTSHEREGVDRLLQSPAFGLTWDIGHDAAAGGADGPFILDRKDRLRHMHIHDAKGGKNHLALGEGELHLEEHFKWAEQLLCRCVLETKTVEGLRSSVDYLRKRQWM